MMFDVSKWRWIFFSLYFLYWHFLRIWKLLSSTNLIMKPSDIKNDIIFLTYLFEQLGLPNVWKRNNYFVDLIFTTNFVESLSVYHPTPHPLRRRWVHLIFPLLRRLVGSISILKSWPNFYSQDCIRIPAIDLDICWVGDGQFTWRFLAGRQAKKQIEEDIHCT